MTEPFYKIFRRNRQQITCWFVVLSLFFVTSAAWSRDAAFVDPGTSVGSVNSGDAVKVDPKNEIDMGESALNVARRTTLFFVNQTTAVINVEKVSVNSDSNVTAEISNDDCSKQQTLAPSNRCSVEIQMTPNSPGAWTIEILMTHSGAGRLTRAKISGKTSGSGSVDKRDSGLFLSTKEVKPVDFGEMNLGEGKSVRSALMVNDSPAPITLFSIDVIEADNGLQRLDQGCAVDMELKPGESCPVTLVWTPTDAGHISTDLIIRHSGQLGFAVIPIRGVAKSPLGLEAVKTKDYSNDKKLAKSDNGFSLPPSPPDLNHMTDKMPAINASALATASSASFGTLRLIGTVGNRALLYKPDGTTAVVQAGDNVDFDPHTVKVVAVGAKDVQIEIDGKTKKLVLETVSELTDKAKSAKQQAQVSTPAAPLSASSSSLSSSSTGLPSLDPATVLAPNKALTPIVPSSIDGASK
jgi:hypothetical protein